MHKDKKYMNMMTREAIKHDIEDIVNLVKQLKPKSKKEEVKSAFSEILTRKDHTIIVCIENNNRIVGYIHGLVRLVIGNPLSVEVGGIVIQHEYRGKGLGSLLLSRVEEWAKERQISVMTLASSVQRTNAHNFYMKNGYERYRDRFHFRKELMPEHK